MLQYRRNNQSPMRNTTFPKDTLQEMHFLIKKTKTASETKRVQCVLMGAGGVCSKDIAVLVGYTPTHVRRVWSGFKKNGSRFLLQDGRGGRRH